MTMTSSTSLRHGLTEGLSSKIMRASRPSHLPSLMLLHQKVLLSDRSESQPLYGRLEELLVFEIPHEGDATYKRFNVRSLHKYVINAIRTGSKSQPLESVDYPTPAPSSAEDESRAYTTGRANSEDNVDASFRGAAAAADGSSIRRKRLGGFLHPRDMRKLITPFSASNEPELIVRRHVMLLNFDPLRAIILRDRTIVLVPNGADSLLVQLEKRIHGKGPNSPFTMMMTSHYQSSTQNSTLSSTDHPPATLDHRDGSDNDGEQAEGDAGKLTWMDEEWADIDAKEWMDLSFELQCVDAVLSLVMSTMAEDIVELQQEANAIISALVTHDTFNGDLSEETLRTIKNTVREMISRVQGFNRAINTVLEDNEDLALMNLSRLLTHPHRFVQPVSPMVLEEESDDPELVLEAHVQQGHTLINALALLEGQITSTEEYANRKSDAIRNQLLYVNTVISIMTLAVGVGSLVGSFFGMNVLHPYQYAPHAFVIIVFSTLAAMIVICVAPWLILLKPELLRCGFAGQVLRHFSQ